MKQYLKPLSYVLLVHVVALVIMSLFRLVFYLTVAHQLTPDVSGQPHLIATAFLRGVWFDNVIACYITALPLVVVCVMAGIGWSKHWIYRALNVWYGVFYALVFMAEAGNIPYFNYFTKMLNASIWNWAEYGGTTLGMIFGEASYYLYIACYFIAIAAFVWMLRFLRKQYIASQLRAVSTTAYPLRQKLLTLPLTLVLLGACFLGIRGRLGYNPIKVSAAYFCASPVLNNVGVNPMFSLLNSTLDALRPENRTLHLMPPAQAVAQVQQLYGRKGIDGLSPIARQVRPEGKPTRQNVVVVLMESMSAKLMGAFGNPHALTPNLDSLYHHSLSFSNCYSAGNHTNHGLYATLYSFPSIMFRNAMKGTSIPVYSGLPTVLQKAGYSTMFFMTHESQYDNMNAFLRTNGYDEIYAQENYPREKVVNHFGVPDDYLFTYALPVLRRHAAQHRPFFATLLTISNHPPYVIPQAFNDPKLTPEQQIVRYADHCIGAFMREVQKEPWAKNTLFVFLGDHGKMVGQADCELPESFNHIPLIFHASWLKPEQRTQFTGQVDVAPTILGLLRQPYVQNNFGLDLLHDAPRPAAFYTADKTIAARNATSLYVYNAEDQREYCYHLAPNGKPRPATFGPDFQQLKSYVFPLLQTTEYMVQHGMTKDKY